MGWKAKQSWFGSRWMQEIFLLPGVHLASYSKVNGGLLTPAPAGAGYLSRYSDLLRA